MIYIIFALITILNISDLFLKRKKEKEEYLEEKRQKKLKLKYLYIDLLNISNIIIYITLLIILLINNNLNIIELLCFIVTAFTYIINISSRKKIKKFKYVEPITINNKYIIIILTTISVLITANMGKSSNIDNFLYLINTILCIGSLITLMCYFIINKDIVYYKETSEEDNINDIHFYIKLSIDKLVTYLILELMYILIFYINIKYSYIFHVALILVIIGIIIKKIKKVQNQSLKLYNTISINKELPGIKYAFQFIRDLLLIKKIIYFTIFYIGSVGVYYLEEDIIFTFYTVAVSILLVYILYNDKKYLIKYIKELNKEFIEPKKYSIKQNKEISYIEKIKIFNTIFYKLIIIDNQVYESNIILYDPELYIKDVDVYINKNKINDYIIVLTKLYDYERED